MNKLLAILLVLFAFDTFSQQHFRVPAVIIDGDTIPYIQLNDVYITTKITRKLRKMMARNEKLIHNIERAMPYAIICRQKMVIIDNNLAKINSKADRKKYLETAEQQLKQEFEGQLKNLTYAQGKLLIKLIDRETGRTPYHLIKDYKSTFNAVFWNSFASIFGMNLNRDYEVENEQEIEYIIKMLGYN